MQVTNKKVKELEINDLKNYLGEFPVAGLTSLEKCIPEAKNVWDLAMKKMSETEDALNAVLRLNEKPKLYALDAIAVFKELNINKIQRDKIAQLFALYYLAVHLFDDAVEDTEKLRRKFNYNGNVPKANHVSALIASFSLNLDLCFSRILGQVNPLSLSNFLRQVNTSLSKQFRYFMIEKNRSLTTKETLEAKQHCVSGESTAFMIECMKAVGVKLGKNEKELRKALYYLGSLTQFTDDFRDLGEDRVNKNLNLIVSMEKEFGKAKAIKVFSEMYLKEEKLMVSHLKKAGIANIEIFKSIPWHPFFMKHLI